MRFRQLAPEAENGSHNLEYGSPDTEQINDPLFQSLNNQQAKLVLTYRGQEKLFTPGPRIFSLGRSSECDIVVNDRLSSRRHARFVYRRGKFVIVDHSTNGTFIKMNRQTEICLVEQEQLPLTGSGTIGLGTSTSKCEDNVIHFSCVYASHNFLDH